MRVRGILTKLETGRNSGTLSSTGPYPIIVLAGLAVFGLAAGRSVARTARPVMGGSTASPLVLMTIGIVLHLVMLERVGFIGAAAVLFWFTARAFDAKHPLRDALFAIALAVGSYVLFARLLQLQLPAGILAGWL
jgi:Tripartite tricarboxylate transporter TctB family